MLRTYVMVDGKTLVLGLKSRILWVVDMKIKKTYTKSSLSGLNDVMGISNSPSLILPLTRGIPG